MKPLNVTRDDNYFDNFYVGQTWRHWRGKTIEVTENVVLTNLVMNSASGHFDEHVMRSSKFGKRIQFGGVTASIVLGLASEDTSENIIEEVDCESIRFTNPVFHGDTLYAASEVLETEPLADGTGLVQFRHVGFNQDNKVVCEIVRRVRVKNKERR